jgi:hypothetical protein
MNPSGTDDRARRSEAQTCGRLQGENRYSNEKKTLSTSLTTLHRPYLPALLAQWRESAREDGTRGHGLELEDDRDMSVLHSISFQRLFSG